MVPGKIISIDGDIATIDYEIEQRKAKIIDNFKVGEYVIVQGGIVIQKVPEQEAKDSLALYKKAVA